MIVVDIETTGLNPIKHSIIEIGAFDFNNPDEPFFIDFQAKPNSEVDPIALGVNGHTIEDIFDESKPTQLEAITRFHEWLKTREGDITMVGQNPRFDADFLAQAYNECDMKFPFGYRTIDLHSLVIGDYLKNNKVIPLRENSFGFKTLNIHSDLIMEYVGIPAEPKPHKGINGVIYEAEAFSRLVYGKNLLEEFSIYPVPDYLKR